MTNLIDEHDCAETETPGIFGDPVAIVNALREEISELRLVVSGHTEVIEGLKARNNALTEAHNNLVATIKNIPNNDALIYVLTESIIKRYNNADKGLELKGAFNFTLEWTDAPLNDNSIRVELRKNADDTNKLVVSSKSKEDGEWIELAETEETTGLYEIIRKEAVVNGGVLLGNVRYLSVVDHQGKETDAVDATKTVH